MPDIEVHPNFVAAWMTLTHEGNPILYRMLKSFDQAILICVSLSRLMFLKAT